MGDTVNTIDVKTDMSVLHMFVDMTALAGVHRIGDDVVVNGVLDEQGNLARQYTIDTIPVYQKYVCRPCRA